MEREKLKVAIFSTSENVSTKELFESVKGNDIDKVKKLIEQGVNINAEDYIGWRPLHWAVHKGNINITELLVKAGAEINSKTKTQCDTPLHIAAWENYPDIAKLLIKHGADLNAENMYGIAPIHYVVQHNNPEVVDFFIKNGADVNARDKCGWTPLHYVIHQNYPKVAEILLKHGADLSLRDYEKRLTPLQHARSIAKYCGNRQEIINLLQTASQTIISPGKIKKVREEILSEIKRLGFNGFYDENNAQIDDEGNYHYYANKLNEKL